MTFDQLKPNETFKLDINHKTSFCKATNFRIKGEKYNCLRDDGEPCKFDSRQEVIKVEKSAWQPIETAPKDDKAKFILVCGNKMRPPQCLDWYHWDWTEKCRWDGFSWIDIRTSEYEPTHWMPLPEPFKE